MTLIKVCGLTRHEDIIAVNCYRPEFIGFVFAPSRRRVSKEQACELTGCLDSSIKKVGVFVNENIGTVAGIAEAVGLDVVQIHGDEDSKYICDLRELLNHNNKTRNVLIWKAFRISSNNGIVDGNPFGSGNDICNNNVDGNGDTDIGLRYMAGCIDCLLLDSYDPNSYGGTGKVIDSGLIPESLKGSRIIMAGGLTPDNVSEIIKKTWPYAVDVSSGVETNGLKDSEKIRCFINAVRGLSSD